MLSIDQKEILDGQGVALSLHGPLNGSTAPDLDSIVSSIIDEGIRFICIDGAELSHVSSAGIGLMLLLERRISSVNGLLVFYNLCQEVMILIKCLEMNSVLNILPSEEEAVEKLRQNMLLRRPLSHESTPSEEGVKGEALTAQTPGGLKPGPSGSSIVVLCPGCGGPVSVSGAGDYLCPHCRAAFYVDSEAGVAGEESFETFVIECVSCGTLIRVRNSGSYQCPECHMQFEVLSDQTVIFPSGE